MHIEIQGILGEQSMKKVEHLLIKEKLETSLVLFVSFSKFTIPVGTIFTTFLKKEELNNCCRGKFQVVQVTNQLCKPLNEIPEGYKTICQIDYGNNENFSNNWINNLQVVENWYEWEDIFVFN
jgi:predicted membrane protein